MRDANRERQMDEMQDAMYGMEHALAWLLAALALGLAILGTLVGLDVISLRDTSATIASDADEGGRTLLSTRFWDGAMLLFTATTLGILAYCLHANDHHRMKDLSRVESQERGMWSMEHTLAYVVGLGSLIYLLIGLLVGFNALSDTHDQGDGLIWIWFGLAASTVTAALHTVRHHQLATEHDYIVAIVEERVRLGGTTGPTGQQQPGTTRT